MARRWLDPESAVRSRPARSRGDRRGCAPRPGPIRSNAEELHDALLWLGCLTEAEAQRDAGLDGLARRAGRRRSASLASIGPAPTLVDSGRTADAVPRAVAGRAGSSRRSLPPADQAQNDLDRETGAGRDPARPAGRSRPGHGDRARDAARAGAEAAIAALGRAGSRRRDPARPLHSPASTTSNGATGACSPASIATRSERLRAEIEPVAARDFLRFLFAWQHVDEDARWKGRTRLPRRARHARRLRSAGPGLGDRNPAGAHQGL